MFLQNLLGGQKPEGQAPMGLASMMAPENRQRTALILSSIGSSLKGQNNTGGTLQTLMALDMMKDKKEKEGRLKQERAAILRGLGGGATSRPIPQRNPDIVRSLGLDMGRSQPVARNTVTAGGAEYDMGHVNPWAGKEDIQQGIFAGESGGDYDALFGFSNRSGPFSNVKLTDMTVDQALAFADPQGPYGQWVKGRVGRVATPMGAYQVVGTTLGAAKKAMGLTGQERMTPELQDQIGAWVLENQGTGAWEGYRGPQSVQVAQNGGWDRQTMMKIMGSEAFSQHEKQFYLEEWRNQQKAGRGELSIQELSDGFKYYVDPTGQTPPRRVAPDVQATPKDDRTTLQKNVEWLMAEQDMSRAEAIKAARGGVNVFTGDQVDPRPVVDKPPKGFQRRWDADKGTYVDEAIPGSEPASERGKSERSFELAMADYDRKYDLVSGKIDEALTSLAENGRWVAGAGSLLAYLPETEARDFKATVDTIKANLGFEELQAMRDSSPTGGALGQVTEREIAFLQAMQGNLDRAQSPEQLSKVLTQIKQGRNKFRQERLKILKGDQGVGAPLDADDPLGLR